MDPTPLHLKPLESCVLPILRAATRPVPLPPQVPPLLHLHDSYRHMYHRSLSRLPRTQREPSPTADLVIIRDFSSLPLKLIKRTDFHSPTAQYSQ